MKSGKGSIVSAEVVKQLMKEFGVTTEWAVRIYFQSPTGDGSDFLYRDLPCLSKSQACSIADGYNEEVAPYLLGVFEDKFSERPTIYIETPLHSRIV
jgi:hypothetical protein